MVSPQILVDKYEILWLQGPTSLDTAMLLILHFHFLFCFSLFQACFSLSF